MILRRWRGRGRTPGKSGDLGRSQETVLGTIWICYCGRYRAYERAAGRGRRRGSRWWTERERWWRRRSLSDGPEVRGRGGGVEKLSMLF